MNEPLIRVVKKAELAGKEVLVLRPVSYTHLLMQGDVSKVLEQAGQSFRQALACLLYTSRCV